MWLIAVYDCPMTTPEARHDYTVFRKRLLNHAFIQVQYSLYVRHFPTMAAAEAMIQRLKHQIPPGAKVAFMLMTDKQYGMTREFLGPRPYQHRPDAPEQIMLI
ncbi:CRISPR-associated Cas2 family protein [Isoalcanivorax pacificus W11-5]|uniref:CRISPR-associated endoribonuclease Cas2 n=1 Tax=Isoalcanivorax pacificus W11-5 TaxID=391936 RepID=A0A0B4XJV1_9GAMM|nr:CRISPR-associated endonuclease Cas2 [Isoalcanivorax pacificus]AJD47356.1 CRISPR-associated Cas2 family protein [Isoalcanivorax pacificus W11-5]